MLLATQRSRIFFPVSSVAQQVVGVEEPAKLTKRIKQDGVGDSECARPAPSSRFYANEPGRPPLVPSEAKSHLIIEEIPDGLLHLLAAAAASAS